MTRSTTTDERAVSLEDVARGLSIAGVLVYGVLFIGYHRYYYVLGVSPEELGIGNAYLLPRAIPFVVLGLVYAAVVAATVWLSRWFIRLAIAFFQRHVFKLAEVDYPGFTRAVFIAGLFFYPGYALFRALRHPGFGPMSVLEGLTSLLAACTLAASLYWGTAAGRRATLLAGALLSVVYATQLMTGVAEHMAEAVLSGRPVSGAGVSLGVPLLDVSAYRVDLEWIGPPGQRPALFGGDTASQVPALLIGASSDTAIVLPATERSSRTVTRIPRQNVLITRR